MKTPSHVPRLRFVVALLLVLNVAAQVPLGAQGPFSAQIQLALQQIGLWPFGVYTNGQVPVYSTASSRFLPGSSVAPAYPLISPSFTGQITGPTNNTCTAPTYSATGQTGTGMSISTTPSILLGVSGTCRFTLTATELTLTGLLVGPASTAAAPAYAATGALTTGLAITTTPSFILSVAGVAKLTGTATALASTVPIIPTTTNTLSIGDSTHQWAEAYILALGVGATPGASGTINLGASGVTTLTSETTATLQFGLDAAGVTDQMLKGPDRITSDGLGGAVTVAGGRNRGAFAGGPIIFQTSPAAGVGVTGTLATALTIDSTKQATFDQPAIATTSTTSVLLRNATAATVGATVQLSPRLAIVGNGWDSDDAVSRPTLAYWEILPVTGTTVNAIVRLGYLDPITAAINTLLSINQAGSLTAAGNLVASNNVQTGSAGYVLNGAVVDIGTAPTIASGGCSSPAVTHNSFTAAFLITIGTSCTGVKTLTLTLPAAAHFWACDGNNNTSDAQQQTNYPVFRATSATAVVLTSYDRVTDLQEDFTAADTYLIKCRAE